MTGQNARRARPAGLAGADGDLSLPAGGDFEAAQGARLERHRGRVPPGHEARWLSSRARSRGSIAPSRYTPSPLRV
jgi:hypothetical protein